MAYLLTPALAACPQSLELEPERRNRYRSRWGAGKVISGQAVRGGARTRNHIVRGPCRFQGGFSNDFTTKALSDFDCRIPAGKFVLVTRRSQLALPMKHHSVPRSEFSRHAARLSVPAALPVPRTVPLLLTGPGKLRRHGNVDMGKKARARGAHCECQASPGPGVFHQGNFFAESLGAFALCVRGVCLVLIMTAVFVSVLSQNGRCHRHNRLQTNFQLTPTLGSVCSGAESHKRQQVCPTHRYWRLSNGEIHPAQLEPDLSPLALRTRPSPQ
ncbi:hypothetical protein PoB_001451500 [Plakobranchus ocellatus]|uniref:Uncharacterized protein n=1 Tax=Plakobranchus ocellatus TaxID=259542 RepID=A0AAV3YXR5_9GAST|nr:hypothetical protein PoB_001451500 [Plakobranchus ocellatus]